MAPEAAEVKGWWPSINTTARCERPQNKVITARGTYKKQAAVSSLSVFFVVCWVCALVK